MGLRDVVSVRKLMDCLSTAAAAVYRELSKCGTLLSASQTCPMADAKQCMKLLWKVFFPFVL